MKLSNKLEKNGTFKLAEEARKLEDALAITQKHLARKTADLEDAKTLIEKDEASFLTLKFAMADILHSAQKGYDIALESVSELRNS